MEPKKDEDEYEFSEEDLREIERLARLTDEELEEINREVRHRVEQLNDPFIRITKYFDCSKFDPEEYRNGLINRKMEEKMARTRKRYWLDNKAPENTDEEGHGKQMDLFSLETVSRYLDRETLLTMFKTNKEVANVKDKMIVNNFEFKKVNDFKVFSGVRDYHTKANYDTIRLLKEVVEGKDVPKPKQIIIEMKESGEAPRLTDTVDLIKEGMKFDSRIKLDDLINYDKSKFAITLKELDNGNENGGWYSERAMILVTTGDRTYENLSSIDLHLCTKLTELKARTMNYGGYSTERGCFQFYSNLTEIVLPSSIKKLDRYTFYSCEHLVSIELPEQVNYLGKLCFDNCTSISSIDLPTNITYIGSSCFSGCRNLRRISIPSQITRLKKLTFSRCTTLSQVILPSRIEELGECCFQDCVSLSSINIPNSVTRIREQCFSNCTSLNNLIVLDHVQLGWNSIPHQYERERERDRAIWNGRNTIDEITAGSPPNENGGFNGFGARRRDNDDN